MIHVRDLTYHYPPAVSTGAWTTALDGLSFDVPRGHCLTITGPNNAGKSTLCLALAGLAPRLTVGRISGQVEVAGADVQAQPIGALTASIGLVMQDPAGQLFNPSVEDEVAWGLENVGLPPAEMPARIEWALDAVGLEDVPRTQAPQTLSGGQQRRLALAAALALRPAVLILDEPTGGLAPAGRDEVVAALRALREDAALTVLLATNDPLIVAELADEVVLLEGGREADRGTPREVYARLARQAAPPVGPPPASIFAATASARPSIDLSCLTLEEAAIQAGQFALDGASPAAAHSPTLAKTDVSPAIQISDLIFGYEGASAPVLHGLDLTIPAGQFVALTGDNGAGKTTLARHLIGLLRPTGGRVAIAGEDTAGKSIGALAQQVGFAFQNPELQIFNPSVREEVAFGPRNLGLSGPALEAAVDAALEAFGLCEVAELPPAALSFSTRRMVALASVAAMQTPILVLDEPTVGLDAAGQARVGGWLAARHRQGATVLLITHDMELAARCAQRVLVMQGGRITTDGAPKEVFARTDVLHAAGLHAPFAVRLAAALGEPALVADLTPQGAARAWLECLS